MTLSLVLMMLAVARVTRLITTDVLLEKPRGWLTRRILAPNPEGALRSKIAYLIICSWCVSIYTGAAGAGAWYLWHGTVLYVVITAALAASYVTGFLASMTEG